MKLEVGKKYVTRDGAVYGPVHVTKSLDYPWRVFKDCNCYRWAEDGICISGTDRDPSMDLIKEYEEPNYRPYNSSELEGLVGKCGVRLR